MCRSLTCGREHSRALGFWVAPRGVPNLGTVALKPSPDHAGPSRMVMLNERSVRLLARSPAAPPEVVAWLLLYLLWLEERREPVGS